ncbi:DUF2929 family protein [Oceanobacillus piezotolerans]|uniref:DUF2929 family protein n=2 Tax=Oceanobacillus piezotolerans TaxID=2448030 RepID=A0A498D6X8_9BACI|nr:DUF2929 family protein [Oceanobacillus piezotolerans]
MTIVWAVLIGAAVNYVLTSMGGETFVMSDALIFAVLLAGMAILLGDFALKDKSE